MTPTPQPGLDAEREALINDPPDWRNAVEMLRRAGYSHPPEVIEEQAAIIATLTARAERAEAERAAALARVKRLREEAQAFRDEVLQILYEEIQLKPHGAGAFKVITAGMLVRSRVEALPVPGDALAAPGGEQS